MRRDGLYSLGEDGAIKCVSCDCSSGGAGPSGVSGRGHVAMSPPTRHIRQLLDTEAMNNVWHAFGYDYRVPLTGY